jgi:hypothetical protein
MWNEGTTNFGFPPLVLETASLALLDSCLYSRSIQKILPWFYALKLFQYQYGARVLEGRPHLFHTPSVIKEGLVNSRNILEQLIISNERHEPHRHWTLISSNGIGCLPAHRGMVLYPQSPSNAEPKLIGNRIIKADVFVLMGEENRTLNDSGVKYSLCRSFNPHQCINFVYSLPITLEHLKIWKNTIAILDYLEYMFLLARYVLPAHFKSLTLFFREQTASLRTWNWENGQS